MSRVRILIADGMAQTIALVKKVLYIEQDSFEVVGETSNGQEVLGLIPQVKPHVVLMDMGMQGLSGLEATEQITKDFPYVSVIMMSVQGEDDYKRKAIAAGAKDYIVKPFNYNVLIESIKSAYEQSIEIINTSIFNEYVNETQGDQKKKNKKKNLGDETFDLDMLIGAEEIQYKDSKKEVDNEEEEEIEYEDNADDELEDETDIDDDKDFLKKIEQFEEDLSLMINANHRAVSIDVSADSGSTRLIKQGNYVDVIGFFPQRIDELQVVRGEMAKVVLQNLRVLSVDKYHHNEETADHGKIARRYLVTLSVPKTDVEKLVLAENIGKLKLSLKSLGDSKISKTKGATWEELMQ